MPKKMPAQCPGKSQQNYQTPKDFIDAVKKVYGIPRFTIDLAAEECNKQARRYFDEKRDSLTQDWVKAIGKNGNAWLNPPYENIERWALRCAASAESLRENYSRIFFLVPASVGSNWFCGMYPRCHVVALNGRITFVGHVQAYPKDCILAIFGRQRPYDELRHVSIWRWK